MTDTRRLVDDPATLGPAHICRDCETVFVPSPDANTTSPHAEAQS